MRKSIIKFISLFIVFSLLLMPYLYADENETVPTVGESAPVETAPVESNTVVSPGHIEEVINGNKLIISDEANLLSETERVLLKKEMEKVTEYGHVAFITINNNPLGSATKYNESYYYKTFGHDSGIVFLIDMQNRELILSSDGYIDTVVTKSKKDSIADNVYRYASYGRYDKTAMETFEQINKLLAGGKILEPMKYISNIFISLVLGFIFCLFHVLKVSNIRKASKDDILKNCVAAVTVANIVAKKTGTRKVYHEPSSSSGGGFSGGGGGFSGGGGGFSGSSGGHRF